MEPKYIDIQLDKFEVCCWKDCGCDAHLQRIAHQDKQRYTLPSCQEHINYIEDFRNMLEEGSTPHKLKSYGLNLEEIFIVPDPNVEQKCRYLAWRDFKYPKKQKPKVDKPKMIESPKVANGWRWISNIGRWMNIKGQIVPVSRLSGSELVSSAIAIRRINFSRITKRVRWIDLLTPPLQPHDYPTAALQVGYEAAGEKLEEFKEEIEARGLLSKKNPPPGLGYRR